MMPLFIHCRQEIDRITGFTMKTASTSSSGLDRIAKLAKLVVALRIAIDLDRLIREWAVCFGLFWGKKGVLVFC